MAARIKKLAAEFMAETFDPAAFAAKLDVLSGEDAAAVFVAIASAPKRGKRGKRLTTRNAQLTVYPAFLRARVRAGQALAADPGRASYLAARGRSTSLTLPLTDWGSIVETMLWAAARTNKKFDRDALLHAVEILCNTDDLREKFAEIKFDCEPRTGTK